MERNFYDEAPVVKKLDICYPLDLMNNTCLNVSNIYPLDSDLTNG